MEFSAYISIMEKEMTKYDRIMREGKYYQYPECCIKHFQNLVRGGSLVGVPKVKGTCFVPCPKCWNSGEIDAKNFSAVWNSDDHDWIVEEKC